MNSSAQIKYLTKYVEFWLKLNTPEQTLLRNILSLSTPNHFIGMDRDELINQFIALGKFRTEISLIDLGGKTNDHWLSKSTITACKGLLDKGLVWLDDNHFQINGITLRFKGYTEQLPYSKKELSDIEKDDDLEKF